MQNTSKCSTRIWSNLESCGTQSTEKDQVMDHQIPCRCAESRSPHWGLRSSRSKSSNLCMSSCTCEMGAQRLRWWVSKFWFMMVLEPCESLRWAKWAKICTTKPEMLAQKISSHLKPVASPWSKSSAPSCSLPQWLGRRTPQSWQLVAWQSHFKNKIRQRQLIARFQHVVINVHRSMMVPFHICLPCRISVCHWVSMVSSGGKCPPWIHGPHFWIKSLTWWSADSFSNHHSAETLRPKHSPLLDHMTSHQDVQRPWGPQLSLATIPPKKHGVSDGKKNKIYKIMNGTLRKKWTNLKKCTFLASEPNLGAKLGSFHQVAKSRDPSSSSGVASKGLEAPLLLAIAKLQTVQVVPALAVLVWP